MSEKVYCLLDGLDMLATACPHVYSTLTDPAEIEMCRGCECHPEKGFAIPESSGHNLVADPAEKPKGTLIAALKALAKAAGISKGSVSSFYYLWKAGKTLPNGPAAQKVLAAMAAAGVTWSDIADGTMVKAEAPRPDPAFPLPAVPVEPEENLPGDPQKITDVCVLSRPVEEEPGQIIQDCPPTAYGGGHLTAIRETEAAALPIATRRIEVSEFYLREPAFEEVLTTMKRRLPVGTKITIEL